MTKYQADYIKGLESKLAKSGGDAWVAHELCRAKMQAGEGRGG